MVTPVHVRVRFAPSPTGYLHVGGARTALFNWLFARRHGGTFVLRIEDTDVERSSDEMVTGILDGLRWLGIDWDEGPEVGGPYGPYFQSERLARYREMAETLVTRGHAYYCYCDPEALKAERDAAQQRGEGYTYDRRCLALPPVEVARREAAGDPRAIRVHMPEGTTRFHDLVRGEIAFANDTIEDFVILRSDGHPTYHLSVVADDVDMRITHVVRGEDHISNTPKQVRLYEALGERVPAFAHVPLILGPDKRRLSKRHGATSVTEYARQGFLPEAMFNFLALLGWSPGDDRELFTREELIAAFSLEGISGGNAVFNPEKLEWFNQQHIAALDEARLEALVRDALEQAGLWREEFAGPRRPWLSDVVQLLRPRLRRVADVADYGRPFFLERVEYDEAAVKKHLADPAMSPWLEELASIYERVPFDATPLEAALRDLAARAGTKAGPLIHAVRVAVTGRAVSPGLFDVLVILGRDTVVSRLREAAVHCLTTSSASSSASATPDPL
jgi:glutamyl-tRNA synthetase